MPKDYWKYAKYANFAMSFGVTMAMSLFLGYYGGSWLDNKFGTSPIFLVMGILAGTGLAFYSMLKELMALERMNDPEGNRKDE